MTFFSGNTGIKVIDELNYLWKGHDGGAFLSAIQNSRRQNCIPYSLGSTKLDIPPSHLHSQTSLSGYDVMVLEKITLYETQITLDGEQLASCGSQLARLNELWPD